MVLLGARGDTATQMAECLRMLQLQDDAHVRFSRLLTELSEIKAPCTLSAANRLYGEETYGFTPTFLEVTKEMFKADLESVDFIGGSEEARLNINRWVERQTHGKIPDLLAQGVVDGASRLVLVNAVYFKGSWSRMFKEAATCDAPFRVNKTETKTVKMMYQSSKFPFFCIPEFNCQVLELPYSQRELSMLVFLPDDIMDGTTGLEQLERSLTYDLFTQWTHPDGMREQEVRVRLPRFKMQEMYDLKEALVSMGVVNAFDVALADFSGMSPAEDLVLSQVLHKSFVEVNEEGTEAAAAAAAVMMLRCARPAAAFIADHPFLFFIRHNPSMSVLFAGRCCSPE
ncbi:leukocyte elastase inhibitor-like isoform X2 [Brachionichthys hirsutus]|uniref:leukocyte elastase inhibitor-like isoform X2 n=1 Tax=Brachionichthys hirsutus TaxID=412623 RepID=UPI0036045F22